jgi:hypothetical protein
MGEPSGRFRLSVIRMVPRPSRATSAPVNTARTPGARRAAPESMDRIFAWACIDRTTTAWACPGRFTSLMNRPPP